MENIFETLDGIFRPDKNNTMETKHTKGEWIQNGYNGVHLKTGECIAITEGENRKANAVLISAAPDLLEALIAMCDAQGEGIKAEMKAYDMAKAAIHKATE